MLYNKVSKCFEYKTNKYIYIQVMYVGLLTIALAMKVITYR